MIDAYEDFVHQNEDERLALSRIDEWPTKDSPQWILMKSHAREMMKKVNEMEMLSTKIESQSK
jgi:hypothetical protein